MKHIYHNRIVLGLAVLKLAATVSRVSGDDLPSLSHTETKAPTIRLAVGGFAALNDTEGLQRQNALLIDILTARLSQTGRFQLVERQAIDAVTREISLSLSQVSKPAEAIQAGKLLRADWLLLGSLLNSNGTNTAIVKIVDAQTGIIRDLAAIPTGSTNLVDVSGWIAEFVVNSADRVSRTEQRIFFGIGGFEDLSINNRYPDFRKGLRASLERIYQGTRYAVVERAMVAPLLAELRLNLGGLSGSNLAEVSVQPGFLLVDGTYQSYQDENAKINLILRVQEIGGSQRLYSLKEPPGKALDEKIVSILNGALRDLRESSPQQTRSEEALTQLARGKERARIQAAGDNYFYLGGYPQRFSESEREKRLRNITEAIEAFEATLLLDPDNAEAKTYLAICLLDPQIGKKEAARDYLREAIAASTNAPIVKLARRQLASSYLEEDDRHALDLFLALDRDVSQPAEHVWVLRMILDPLCRLHQSEHLSTAEGIRLLERCYLADCQNLEFTNSRSELLMSPLHMQRSFGAFERFYQDQREMAEAHLEKFLPHVVKKHPNLAPYIWTSYTLWRSVGSTSVPTNVIERFRASLEFCRDQPENVSHIMPFYERYALQLLEWSVCNREYRSGEIIAEIMQQIIDRNSPERADLRSFLLQTNATSAKAFYYVGYCERALGKWQQALEAFERAQKQADTVIMEANGPWGGTGTRVSARELMAECRQHLSLTVPTDSEKPASERPSKAPITFALGKPVLTLGRATVFACDGDVIWLTDGYAPFIYNKHDQSLTDLDWPTNIEQEVTCIRVDKKTVWWGTRGSGLVEMDKQTKRCRVYKETEGLLLPSITALALSQEKLWIGFGRKYVGGVGYLDLRSHRFTGMTPELGLKTVTNRFIPALSSQFEAPRSKIWTLSPTLTGDLWLLSEDIGLRYFSVTQNRWSNFTERILSDYTCMAASSNYVAVGGVSSGSGVVIHTVSNKHAVEVELRDWMKPNNACAPRPCPFSVYSMAVNGEKVWVGGEGFLALVDLKTTRVEKLCNFDPRWLNSAQGLEIEGDDLWVAIKNRLYRLPKTGPI